MSSAPIGAKYIFPVMSSVEYLLSFPIFVLIRLNLLPINELIQCNKSNYFLISHIFWFRRHVDTSQHGNIFHEGGERSPTLYTEPLRCYIILDTLGKRPAGGAVPQAA